MIGVEDAHLAPDFWIRRQRDAHRLVLGAADITAQNALLERMDPSVYGLESLPDTLSGAQVRDWIAQLSVRPTSTLFDERGRDIPAATLDELIERIDLDAVPEKQPTRFGLVVRRTNQRTFPTRLRVFRSRGDADIDLFQENALFPGTPVAIVHQSRDGDWWFVVSPLYAAWVEKRGVAEGTARQVFEYTRKAPYLVVTGATAKTVFTPEQPEVSELQLEMGTRVPLLADWPADRPVNGQHSYAAHVVELPVRGADGSLQFTAALLPRTADVSPDYLPLNRANILRQSFKFLGERYGWGHSYNARDCSGFVAEIYRSFGMVLPRNTRDQAVSSALDRLAFDDTMDRKARLAALRRLEVGDLIYIPRHVMMVIGHREGLPYVIHDTTGITYRDPDGATVRVPLNSVAVTPLVPLLLGAGEPLIDRIYSIQRLRPKEARTREVHPTAARAAELP